jgi:hypothetical protein
MVVSMPTDGLGNGRVELPNAVSIFFHLDIHIFGSRT